MTKPPSRIKYEKSHPVIPIRVSPEVRVTGQNPGCANTVSIGLKKNLLISATYVIGRIQIPINILLYEMRDG